jgi:uncharacterized membrane protein SpoIIM required for sporulation
MVLESILNPKNAEDKPWHVLIITFVYSFISIYFSLQAFNSQASALSIAMITILFVPFFQKLFETEEKVERTPESGFFKRHEKVIAVYSTFFLGVILAFSLVFNFFPDAESVFSLQMDWFKGQGLIAGQATVYSDFFKYLINNSQVMVLVFILSVMFGAGAVLILVWNASIIAVYVGMVVDKIFVNINPGTYFYALYTGFSSIALHGIPEVVAYFISGLAGGILSVAILRENIPSKEFTNVFKDALALLITAEALIIIAAVLEAVF